MRIAASRAVDGSHSAEALWRNRAGGAWLTEELIALGHDVTLFASGDFVDLREARRGLAARVAARRLRARPNALHMLLLERVCRRRSDFDFLHFHLDYYPFSLFSRQRRHSSTTLHGRLDLPEHQPLFTAFSSIPVISISNSQRRPLPQANWVRTVHHGLPEQCLRRNRSSHATSHSLDACAGEGHRPRHPDRAALRHSAHSRRQGRRRRPRLFRERIRPLMNSPDIELSAKSPT